MAIERERAMLMIRGAVVASMMDNSTKTELCRVLDELEPECPQCGGTMVPDTMKCPECVPQP